MTTDHLTYLDHFSDRALDRFEPVTPGIRFHHVHAQPIDARPTLTPSEREAARRKRLRAQARRVTPDVDMRTSRLDWKDDAVCKGHGELFFDGAGKETRAAREHRETKAGRICAECPVSVPCLDWAVRNMEHGYWSGTNEWDRHAIRERSTA